MKFIPLILLVLFFSCSDSKSTATTPGQPAPETEQQKFVSPPVFLDSTATAAQLLDHLENRKTAVVALLKNAAPEKANILYDNYKRESDSAFWLLEEKERPLLDYFSSYYTYDEKTGVTTLNVPDSAKAEVAKIEANEIEFWDVGEGFTALRRKPDFYHKIFAAKVTPDYRRWIEINREEDPVLFSADGGILVPWAETGRRILKREAFLKDFPKSRLTKEVEKDLRRYRYSFFIGGPNTPVFNYDTHQIEPEILLAFRKFSAENPDSETAAMLRNLLKTPQEKTWQDNVPKILGDY